MAVNKVVYANKPLIDLTSDTVTENSLIGGYTAHRSDGTVISGKALADRPNEFMYYDDILDFGKRSITDNLGNPIKAKTVYRKV